MKVEGKSPEHVTRAFLMRCMPNIPSGYRDDWGFEDAYSGGRRDSAIALLCHPCEGHDLLVTRTCAFRGSPVPRCHRLGISPQPAPLGLRLQLSLGVLLASIWW